MAAALDAQKLKQVFESRPDIITGIKRAADSPDKITLFNEITNHVYGRLYGSGDEPAHKRRKVGGEQAGNSANGSSSAASSGNAADEEVLLEVKEISVSIPQRKKLELCFTSNFLYARAPGTTAPIPGIVYAWKDIEFAFYLPVPDKAQVQHNYVLMPFGTSIASKTNPPTIEPLVFTVPATAPKPGTIGGSEAGSAAAVSDTYKLLLHWALTKRLKIAGTGVHIVSADPNKFSSMIRQPHRPNEKAVHVGGFRGSKDGYLFFLENGILWGFKKPLIFIPLNRIAAVSYTNVLQITFNIVIEALTGEADETEEIEFGMLDQKDFAGIDDYVKSNRLQDRSMAEQRKAKLQLAENRKKNGDDATNGEAGANGDGAGGDLSELAKAQVEAEQELQDDEDEDEEDYDPGSDDDSDGSGESSEEDDDDDDAGEGEGDEEDDEEDGEGEEEDVDGEEEEEEVEEEEAEPEPEPPKPMPKKAANPPPPPKQPVQVANRGWATISHAQPADNMDMDEQFDVV